MTDTEKIVMVKAMSDETDESIISAFLSMAGDAIINYVDPFHTSVKMDVIEQYASVQVKLAAYYINKRGWDFQSSHTENGVSRIYETGGIPSSMLKELTPKVGAVR